VVRILMLCLHSFQMLCLCSAYVLFSLFFNLSVVYIVINYKRRNRNRGLKASHRVPVQADQDHEMGVKSQRLTKCYMLTSHDPLLYLSVIC